MSETIYYRRERGNEKYERGATAAAAAAAATRGGEMVVEGRGLNC